jgi:hypothetical protein
LRLHRNSVSPPSFPPPAPRRGTPPPSAGSSWDEFPRFTGTIRVLRLPPARPAPLPFLAPRYRPTSRRRQKDLPRFLGSPNVCMPRSQTPVGPPCPVLSRHADAAFRLFRRRRLPRRDGGGTSPGVTSASNRKHSSSRLTQTRDQRQRTHFEAEKPRLSGTAVARSSRADAKGTRKGSQLSPY